MKQHEKRLEKSSPGRCPTAASMSNNDGDNDNDDIGLVKLEQVLEIIPPNEKEAYLEAVDSSPDVVWGTEANHYIRDGACTYGLGTIGIATGITPKA